MVDFPLTMRSTGRAQRAAEGLLLRSDSTTWLAQVSTWDVDESTIRIHVLPRGRNESECYAALVVSESCEIVGRSLPDYCVAYGRIGNLWLPEDAMLVPELSESDLRELLVEEYTYVWQPQVGLVAFEPGQVLRLHDLIQLDEPKETDWSRALPGVSFPVRLDSVKAVAPPNFQSMLDNGRDDIGQDAAAIDSIPPQDGEPNSGIVGAIGRGLSGLAANIADGIANALPRNASTPGWGDSLAQWANDKLNQISKEVLASRHRELNRLMKMLEANPDEGLRYAIPMGQMDHRGLADGGSSLGRRNVDFQLGGARGPAAIWDMPFEYRQNLLNRYRELANREVQLGRYRRAAYIYAELLGDWNSAAGVLRTGRHFQEAAVLYRDKLKQPLVAAECLEQSGLIADAIELYLAEDYFEKAGDLYIQIDQEERALELFGFAADKSLERDDRLDAARIREMKMGDPASALATLEQGWPKSRQAEACLREIFSHVGGHGDHQRAQAWVSHLRAIATPEAERLTAANVASAINVLAEQANGYPDRRIAESAKDSALTVASHQLKGGEVSYLSSVLAAVKSLQPEDRLLKRDTAAFQVKRQGKSTQERRKTYQPKKNAVEKVRSFQLDQNVEWSCAVGHQGDIYFAGLRGGTSIGSKCDLIVVRASRHGQIHQPDGRPLVVRRFHYPQPILMEVLPGCGLLAVHALGTEANTKERTFPASDMFPNAWRIGSFSALTPSTSDMSTTTSDDIWLISQDESGTILKNCGIHGRVRSTFNPTDIIGGSLHIHARRRAVYFSVAGNLYMMDRHGAVEMLHQGKGVSQIVGSALGARTRVAISTEHGVHVFWDKNDDASAHIAVNVSNPKLCFTRRGLLTVVGHGELQAYRTQGSRCDYLGESRLSSDEIVAVADVDLARCVATLDRTGLVEILRLND